MWLEVGSSPRNFKAVEATPPRTEAPLELSIACARPVRQPVALERASVRAPDAETTEDVAPIGSLDELRPALMSAYRRCGWGRGVLTAC